MCGIAGVVRLDGAPVDAGPVDAMLDTLRHRGPDGRGTWSEGSVALGHVRLAVLDPSEHAHQPMRTDDGRGVLVYNGEVYNFPALRAALEREGARFRSHGDAAVVLEALHRWGPETAIPRFDGMFALAYLDRRDRTLWLARDRFGIKMLSTTEQGGHLVFCSELKGLLAHPRVERRVDRGEVVHYLLYAQQAARVSLFDGLRTLEPGALVRVRGGAISTRRFHDVLERFDPERVRRAASALRPEDAVRRVGSALTESVRSHLVSDAPLGTICSGGVDSSLVTALARDERPDLETFVCDVGGEVSEWPQAQRVARHLGVRLHRIPIDRKQYLDLWPEVTWHRDLPCVHPSDAPLLCVTRACRDRGFKVLLTGEGADEAFAGYAWYPSVYARWRAARRRARLPWLFPRWAKRWRRWKDLPHARLRARGQPDLQFRLAAAVAPAHELRRLAIREHLAPIEPPEDRAVLTKQLDDLESHLSWILHRHDRVGMAGSIEMRLPFLANEVADLGLHLPRRMKLHRGVTKWALKAFAETRLPRDVVHARKKGFAVSPHLHRGTGGLLVDGFVPEILHWTREETRRVLGMARAHPNALFHLTSLEVWGRIFFRGEAPDRVGERLRALEDGAGATRP